MRSRFRLRYTGDARLMVTGKFDRTSGKRMPFGATTCLELTSRQFVSWREELQNLARLLTDYGVLGPRPQSHVPVVTYPVPQLDSG